MLNAEQASTSKVLENKELQDIVSALGCGIGNDFDATKLRYGKIFLLMDADSDGQHIATLLLTFFYRHLPGLIRGGHVYLAQPPLYRIDIGKETHWALDERERDASSLAAEEREARDLALQGPRRDARRGSQGDDARSAVAAARCASSIESELETDRVLNELMGKDAQARFRFIMERARETSADALDV